MDDNARYQVRTGDVPGQVVVGRGNIVHGHSAPAPIDLEALTRFATAVMQALPALRLDPPEHHEAEVLTGEILRASEQDAPDQARLRTLGHSLRTVVEGAAAGALGSGLLSIWTP
jgi:hypothetical protein